MRRPSENAEMEGIWKEAVVAELRHYPNLPIRTEETHKER
jgi:hypothetical protein